MQIHDVVFFTICVTSLTEGVVVVGVIVVVGVAVVVGVVAAVIVGDIVVGAVHKSGLVIVLLLANKHVEHDETLV